MKKPKSVPGQYLISFESDISDAQRSKLFNAQKVTLLEKVGSSPLYLIEINTANVQETIDSLKNSPGVRYVEANIIMNTFGTE